MVIFHSYVTNYQRGTVGPQNFKKLDTWSNRSAKVYESIFSMSIICAQPDVWIAWNTARWYLQFYQFLEPESIEMAGMFEIFVGMLTNFTQPNTLW